MGDIFRRETAKHPEPFTGERFTACPDGQVQIEHYHRYLFARSLVAGLDVLDVASGEGYGSAFVRYSRGKSSIAVDLKRPEGIDLVKRLVAHVDVFADTPFTGNSVTVFLADGTMATGQMLSITREFRHFESIFLWPTAAGRRRGRRIVWVGCSPF